MKINYNGSPEHLANAANARKKGAAFTSSCPHCAKPLNASGVVIHIPTCIDNPVNHVFCGRCGTRIKKRGLRFCSVSCAAFHNNEKSVHTLDVKAKIGESVKRAHREGRMTKTRPAAKSHKVSFRECFVCGDWFSLRGWTNPKKCCSQDCSHELLTRKSNPFRCLSIPFEHDGKTITLQSTWEVAVAEHLDKLGVKWLRPKSIPWTDDEGKKRRYYPDFYLPDFDVYLDPKNLYVQKADQRKLEIVSEKIDLVVGVLDEIIWFIDALVSLGGVEPPSAPYESAVLPLNYKDIPRPSYRS